MFVLMLADITKKNVSMTPLTFQLQGRVLDIVFVREELVRVLLNGCARADGNIVCDDVGRERSQTFVDAPDMQVVHAARTPST